MPLFSSHSFSWSERKKPQTTSFHFIVHQKWKKIQGGRSTFTRSERTTDWLQYLWKDTIEAMSNLRFIISNEFMLSMKYFQEDCDIVIILPYLPDLKVTKVNGNISTNRDNMNDLGGRFGSMDWTQGNLCKQQNLSKNGGKVRFWGSFITAVSLQSK